MTAARLRRLMKVGQQLFMEVRVKKAVLICLLVASTAASADWVSIGSDGEHIYYLDFSTLKIKGNIRKIWNLVDIPSPPPGDKTRSTQIYWSFDCDNDQSSVTFMQNYDGRMGTGHALEQFKDKESFDPVGPGTAGEAMLKAVCSHPS